MVLMRVILTTKPKKGIIFVDQFLIFKTYFLRNKKWVNYKFDKIYNFFNGAQIKH
mgnify:CR=1 FL=1